MIVGGREGGNGLWASERFRAGHGSPCRTPRREHLRKRIPGNGIKKILAKDALSDYRDCLGTPKEHRAPSLSASDAWMKAAACLVFEWHHGRADSPRHQ